MENQRIKLNLASKIFLLIAIAVLISIFSIGSLSYFTLKKNLQEGLSKSLEHIAITAAVMIDGDSHERIASMKDRDYLQIQSILRRVKDSNQITSPLYTLRRSGREAEFIISTDYGSLLGGKYPLRREMLRALAGDGSSSTGIYEDKNGRWMSAYAPIKNSSGKVVAILEVDHHADFIVAQLRNRLFMIMSLCLLVLIISLLVSIPLVKTITSSIMKLDEVAHRLEKWDYNYPVKISSGDEVEYLAKTFEQMRSSLKKHIAELKETWLREKKSHLDSIIALSKAIEIRDPYTKGHIERVSQYSALIAEAMGVPKDDIEKLKYGCILHDIGKIGIDMGIIDKPAKLSGSEYTKIKEHPKLGLEIIAGVEFLEKAKDIVLHHQERFDGGGYPLGLQGDKIPVLARIVALTDAFDAMTSDRPYRSRMKDKKAIETIMAEKGKQFDPEVCKAFYKVKDKIIKVKEMIEDERDKKKK